MVHGHALDIRVIQGFPKTVQFRYDADIEKNGVRSFMIPSPTFSVANLPAGHYLRIELAVNDNKNNRQEIPAHEYGFGFYHLWTPEQLQSSYGMAFTQNRQFHFPHPVSPTPIAQTIFKLDKVGIRRLKYSNVPGIKLAIGVDRKDKERDNVKVYEEEGVSAVLLANGSERAVPCIKTVSVRMVLVNYYTNTDVAIFRFSDILDTVSYVKKIFIEKYAPNHFVSTRTFDCTPMFLLLKGGKFIEDKLTVVFNDGHGHEVTIGSRSPQQLIALPINDDFTLVTFSVLNAKCFSQADVNFTVHYTVPSEEGRTHKRKSEPEKVTYISIPDPARSFSPNMTVSPQGYWTQPVASVASVGSGGSVSHAHTPEAHLSPAYVHQPHVASPATPASVYQNVGGGDIQRGVSPGQDIHINDIIPSLDELDDFFALLCDSTNEGRPKHPAEQQILHVRKQFMLCEVTFTDAEETIMKKYPEEVFGISEVSNHFLLQRAFKEGRLCAAERVLQWMLNCQRSRELLSSEEPLVISLVQMVPRENHLTAEEVRKKMFTLLELLVANSRIVLNLTDWEGRNVLHHLVERDDGELMRRFLLLVEDRNMHIQLMETLDNYHLSPLHLAVERFHSSSGPHILTQLLDLCTEQMIISQHTSNGMNVLHLALMQNSPPLLEVLLSKTGFDVNLPFSDGRRPLELAYRWRLSEEIKSLLRKHGATGEIERDEDEDEEDEGEDDLVEKIERLNV